MSDLIDRQAAIDAMTTTLWHYPIECLRNLNKYEFAKGLAELGLKSVPSAQPIRCKDCKHWNVDGLCRVSKEYVFNDDYFCSRAERWEDG